MNRLSLLVLALVIAALLPIAIPIHVAKAQAISVSDPTGDDRGIGTYGYPSGGGVFKDGVFDITKFEATVEGDYLVLRVYLRDLGGNPWNGPNGWCLQYVAIFIRTSAPQPIERVDTMGLNFLLRPDYAWHYLVILAPGWDEPGAPVPAGQKSALYYANGTVVMQEPGLFEAKALPDENAIEARISKSLITDVENIGKWRIVVAVTSYDGFGPAKIRPLTAAPSGEWQIPATAYATPEQTSKIAMAIAKGVAPRVMDLLVYSDEYPNGITAEQQYQWLSSFDPDKGLPAVVPPLPITTETVSVTVVQTQTLMQTTTETVTSTVTQMQTVTATTTTTQTVTDWTMAGVLGVVLLLIGIGIGYAIKRK
jgi:carbohydrate-binding DOMON domain-containing protein